MSMPEIRNPLMTKNRSTPIQPRWATPAWRHKRAVWRPEMIHRHQKNGNASQAVQLPNVALANAGHHCTWVCSRYIHRIQILGWIEIVPALILQLPLIACSPRRGGWRLRYYFLMQIGCANKSNRCGRKVSLLMTRVGQRNVSPWLCRPSPVKACNHPNSRNAKYLNNQTPSKIACSYSQRTGCNIRLFRCIAEQSNAHGKQKVQGRMVGMR